MSAQVHNYSFSNIGRMFARQNVPSIYGLQKSASGAEPEAQAETVDSVSISPLAPKPLDADLLRDALETGKSIAAGGKIAEPDQTRLREDRIFTAISALSLLGADGAEGTLPRNWPGGIPAPTPEEMEAARRRLSQRLKNAENTANPEALQRERVALLEKIGKRSFLAPAQNQTMETAAAAASN